MLNEQIINIDFKKIDEAIKGCEQPVIIMMSTETMMAFAGQEESNSNINVTENDFDQIVTYKNIPIVPNMYMPFGFVIVK